MAEMEMVMPLDMAANETWSNKKKPPLSASKNCAPNSVMMWSS